MKTKLTFLLSLTLRIVVILLFLISSHVNAEALISGTVFADHYQCKTYDHIVIETRSGYTTAQVYSGYPATHEGKKIYGEFHSYGFKEIYDKDCDEDEDEDCDNVGRIWIDDYMVSKEKAIKWCSE